MGVARRNNSRSPSTSSSADANAVYGTSSGQNYNYSNQFDPLSSTTFEASGLPFLGLTALQNWQGSAGSAYLEDGKEDAWKSFDGGAFRDDPELPLPFSNHHIYPGGSNR